ncbi:MAG: hypothetical protein V3V78_00050 [Candidatus Woesearchaeota archaeon]
MNKKAVELSINFLVVVILSIVILTSGLLIVKRYFGTAEDIKAQLDEQTIAHIEELLDEGDPVAIASKRKVISGGESAIFGLGIFNINDDTQNFKVDIKFSKLIERDQTIVETVTPNPETWLLYEDEVTLGFNDKATISIRIEVPKTASQGTYIYNVNVCYGPCTGQNRYGLTKIYVEA